MENWRGGDWDETQNGAHVMRRKGCAMQNKGITLNEIKPQSLIQIKNAGGGDNLKDRFVSKPERIPHWTHAKDDV